MDLFITQSLPHVGKQLQLRHFYNIQRKHHIPINLIILLAIQCQIKTGAAYNTIKKLTVSNYDPTVNKEALTLPTDMTGI